eukprot:Gb_21206 [translate_table: standard]
MEISSLTHAISRPLHVFGVAQSTKEFRNVCKIFTDGHYGRRELVFKGIRAFRQPEKDQSRNSEKTDVASIFSSRDEEGNFKSISDINWSQSLLATRRLFFTTTLLFHWASPFRYLSAHALGDPAVTIEEVTPPVATSGKLFSSEERTVELFERNTYSVVNIFDVTLRPQLNMTGAVEVPEGNGSGVVWDGLGHIVTNYHVIGNSLSKNPSRAQVVARVSILAFDGVQKNFEGTLVGADRMKDLAVLKVDAPTELLRPIRVGQSSKLRVGQRCLAIGNPFGFDHTLTVGVLSGLNREIFSQTGVTISGGIQTDAAINPGNSGGPLLDSKGNLIGINTAIFTQTGTSAGVGFAIPADIVLKIVPQLIQSGKVISDGAHIGTTPRRTFES